MPVAMPVMEEDEWPNSTDSTLFGSNTNMQQRDQLLQARKEEAKATEAPTTTGQENTVANAKLGTMATELAAAMDESFRLRKSVGESHEEIDNVTKKVGEERREAGGNKEQVNKEIRAASKGIAELKKVLE